MQRYIRLLVTTVLVLAALGMALPALAQANTPIAIGDTVEGSLTNSRSQSRYTFTGESGQFVSITLTSDDFDAYLTLEDADGMFIANDDDSAGSLNSRIGPLALPDNGDYVIVVSSLSSSGTGDYTLSLDAPVVETLDYGDVVEGEFTADETSRTYYFEAESGDAVAIAMDSGDFDAYLRLDAPGGTMSWTDDDSGGDRNALLGPLSLSEGGLYIITASSWGGSDPGVFTLTITRAQITPLELDTPAEAELAAGEPLYFSFEGESGQTVSISVDSGNTIDTEMTLRGPEGYQVDYNDDSSGVDPALPAVTLSSSGTYTLIVQGRYEDESGPLSVLLSAVSLPSLDDGPQRVRLSDKQSSGQVVFSGTAGETVNLTLALDSGDTLPGYIEINQGDTSLGYISSSTMTGMTLALTLPADGIVNIKLDDYSYRVKIVSITLERVTAE